MLTLVPTLSMTEHHHSSGGLCLITGPEVAISQVVDAQSAVATASMLLFTCWPGDALPLDAHTKQSRADQPAAAHNA